MPLHLNTASKPKSDFTPQFTQIVASCLVSAEGDKNLLGQIISNPGQVFASAGLPVQQYDFNAFNTYCREKTDLHQLVMALNSGVALSNVGGVGCVLCQISCYTIAVAVTAVGAGALTLLTAGSAPVIALAAFAGVSAAASLAFIVTLATAITAGVSAVATAICSWTGAC